MSPEEVRKYMERANIYLFTSDFNEGWGAVLNESMNSACAVVASHAIGAVPFLLEHKKNGLIYKNGDINNLYENVKLLLDNQELSKKLGLEAYLTMKKKWNVKEATSKLLTLAESILSNRPVYYHDGPCSKAEIITNKWSKD